MQRLDAVIGGESMRNKPHPTEKDVTPCSEAEEEPRRKEKLFRAPTENILDVIVLGVDGNIRYRSPLFDRMFGEGLRGMHPL